MLSHAVKNPIIIAASLLLSFGYITNAHAGLINFENFSYTGTVTPFGTLADAQNNTNALSGPHIIPDVTDSSSGLSTDDGKRDAYVFADTDSGAFEFATAWFWGEGNPNNTNTGFVQLLDFYGTSVTSLSIGWNASGDEFTVDASGANAGDDEFARLWPAPTIGGMASISSGEFLSYDFSLSATFATPTVDGTKNEFPVSVDGYFSAIFQNTGSDTSLNNFYVADFTFMEGTLAQQENLEFPSFGNFNDIAFRNFEAPVPAPGTALLVVVGIAGWAAATRRKHPLLFL